MNNAESKAAAAAKDELLLRVVAQIMENTAFTEVRRAAAEPVYSDRVRGVALLVHDPVQGEFRLLMADGLLKKLAALVYGSVMPVIDEQLENDFLAELLNTIAGRLLAELLPPEQSFQLGLPQSQDGAPACPESPCRSWHFTIEDQPMTISLHGATLLALSPPPPPPIPDSTGATKDDGWG